jgi:NAD(P)-dependent dehydrogenase (short-subunit alcohol dehydrogenase family)
MNNPFSLEGKNILITGASSGIGKQIAIECSNMGAFVIITGRNEERLKNTFSKLRGEHNRMFIADLQSQEDIDTLAKFIECPIDGLVHGAGINDLVPFQFITKESLENIFTINYFAPVLLSKSLLKEKKIAKKSSIVFISSISGVYCSAVASSMYSSTKGAINGLIKGMALDLAPKMIRVNSVNPGVVETNIFDSTSVTQEQLTEDRKKYPLKRFGKPEDIAYAAIYLLSDASSWVTGTNLVIDGGFTLL